MRFLPLFLLCFVLAPIFMVSDVQAGNIKAMADTIKKPITITAKQSKLLNVVFNHTSHRGITCFTCHHAVTETKGRYVSCRECHADKGRTSDPQSLFTAAHDKQSSHSCYACHSNQAKESPKYTTVFYNCRPCHMGPQKAPMSPQGTPNAQNVTHTAHN